MIPEQTLGPWVQRKLPRITILNWRYRVVLLLLFVPALVAMLSTAAHAMDSSTPAADSDLQSFLTRAYDYLAQRKSTYALRNPREQLRLLSDNTDKLNFRHLKFQQVENGVKVWGHELIVHFNAEHTIYKVSGSTLPIESAPPMDKLLRPAQAQAMFLKSHFPDDEKWQVSDNELVLLQLEKKLLPAYLLTANYQLRREFYFIDANTAALLRHLPGTYN